jgi:hypothetical protein
MNARVPTPGEQLVDPRPAAGWRPFESASSVERGVRGEHDVVAADAGRLRTERAGSAEHGDVVEHAATVATSARRKSRSPVVDDVDRVDAAGPQPWRGRLS